MRIFDHLHNTLESTSAASGPQWRVFWQQAASLPILWHVRSHLSSGVDVNWEDRYKRRILLPPIDHRASSHNTDCTDEASDHTMECVRSQVLCGEARRGARCVFLLERLHDECLGIQRWSSFLQFKISVVPSALVRMLAGRLSVGVNKTWELFLSHHISCIVEVNFEVFCIRMLHGIFWYIYCALIVTIERDKWFRHGS